MNLKDLFRYTHLAYNNFYHPEFFQNEITRYSIIPVFQYSKWNISRVPAGEVH